MDSYIADYKNGTNNKTARHSKINEHQDVGLARKEKCLQRYNTSLSRKDKRPQ
jgi:hypothetical protein